MSCLQSNSFLKTISYLCVTGDNEVYINPTTNWNKSQSNCKAPNSKEINATDMWSLYCLSLDSCLLITPLVSSNFSLHELQQYMECRKQILSTKQCLLK
jgi:hypothetical protein